jgi:hypothetical protein
VVNDPQEGRQISSSGKRALITLGGEKCAVLAGVGAACVRPSLASKEKFFKCSLRTEDVPEGFLNGHKKDGYRDGSTDVDRSEEPTDLPGGLNAGRGPDTLWTLDCPQGQVLFRGEGLLSPVCLKKGERGGYSPEAGNFPNPAPSSCRRQGLMFVRGKKANACCPRGSAGVVKEGVALCGRRSCDPLQEKPCGGHKGRGVICCDRKTQTCGPNGLCLTRTAPGDEHMCPASSAFPGYRITARNGVERCAMDPGGYPVALNAALALGNPAPVRSLGVFMVRDKRKFTLDGTVYAVTPHAELGLPGTLILRPYNKKKYALYEYPDIVPFFYLCRKTPLEAVSKTVNAEKGGTLSLKNEVRLYIPPGALSETQRIVIRKYRLSDCYIPESRNSNAGRFFRNYFGN